MRRAELRGRVAIGLEVGDAQDASQNGLKADGDVDVHAACAVDTCGRTRWTSRARVRIERAQRRAAGVDQIHALHGRSSAKGIVCGHRARSGADRRQGRQFTQRARAGQGAGIGSCLSGAALQVQKATVDDQFGAGDKRRFVGGQKQDAGGHLPGLPKTAERRQPHLLLA